jgi:hypothetical protein
MKVRASAAWKCGAPLLVVLLTGCTSATLTQIAAKQDEDAPRNLESLFVISYIARADQSWDKPFREALGAELKAAGVRHVIQERTPVAVQSDQDAYAREVAEFAPEAVLAIHPREGTVDREGRHLMRRFEAGLFQQVLIDGRRKLLWRAGMTLRPRGFFIAEADLAALARDLVTQLGRDGIVKLPQPVEDTPRHRPRRW